MFLSSPNNVVVYLYIFVLLMRHNVEMYSMMVDDRATPPTEHMIQNRPITLAVLLSRFLQVPLLYQIDVCNLFISQLIAITYRLGDATLFPFVVVIWSSKRRKQSNSNRDH